VTEHSFKQQFFDRLAAAAEDGTFVRLNLGGPNGRDRSLRNVFVRPVRLRGSVSWSFTYRHATRDITKNLAPADAMGLLQDLVGNEFSDAFLSTTTGTLHLNVRKGRNPRLIPGNVEDAQPPDLAHDQPRHRTLAPREHPWLQDLGVTGPDDRVRLGMEAKYRQIHRFIELVAPLIREAKLPADRPPAVLDMGCGKGYLTFALHDHLRRTLGRPVRVTGVEQRPELAEAANRIAAAHGMDGLQFITGTIGSTILTAADVVVALHACDTATDDAIAKGVHAGARLIVAAPCCHREVAHTMVSPPPLIDALRHGILFQREAEFVTDALRAALLEAAGYEAKVFEFVSPEHTSKNLMISAVRRGEPSADAARRAADLAAFYGVPAQRLAHLLRIPLVAPAATATAATAT